MFRTGGGETGPATAEDYIKLIARDPYSLRFAEYADELSATGKLPDALAVCEYGIARHPGYATGHAVMAEILLKNGAVGEAEEELQEALRLDPFHPRVRLARGNLLLSQGQTEAAAAEFEAALTYSPGLPEAEARLAEARGRQAPTGPSAASPAAVGRRPGEMPAWVTAGAGDIVAAAVADCPAVAGAALVPPGGASVALELVEEGRRLASRLGAGRLRSLLVSTRCERVLHTPMGDAVLTVALRPGADADEARQQVEAVLDAGPSVAEAKSGV
ncbi:MAG: tetratricopeptide repeat protein [Armatimonadota bacterium]